METITVGCENCGLSFEKKATEVRRSEKLGRKHYCSLACSGAKTSLIVNGAMNANTTGLVANNRLDQFSPFRSHLARLKQRRHDVTVTLEYLKEVWDQQGGVCPLTGWQLYMPATSKWNGELCRPDSASLDRIDNSLGYVVGNVRWLSFMANIARRQWTDGDVVKFAQAVVNHHDIDVIRVDGNCSCPDCGELYYNHPRDMTNVSGLDGEWYLYIGCDGRRLKT